MLRRGDRGGAGAREHHADRRDVLAHELQRVQERRPGDDRRAVLVVVEHRDGERLAQRLLDGEAVGGADVFEVDAAHGGLEQLAEADQILGVLGTDFQVEHVDVGERLEQDPLSLHHRLAGERPDVAEAEHGRPVGDHGDQVALGGVGVGVVGAGGDLAAWLRHARRVGERQVALVLEGLGRRDLDLAGPAARVVIEGLLAPDRHRGHKSFFVKGLCYPPRPPLSSRRRPALSGSGSR